MKKNLKTIIFFCLFIALAAGLTLWFLPYIKQLTNPLNQAAFEAWISALGIAGPLVLFGIQVLQIIIAFIPGGPVEILSGVLYGTIGGTAICLAGCIAASTLTFSVSRKFGRKLLYLFITPGKVESWKWLEDSAKIETVIFLLFFIPGTPKDLLTYIVGITKLSLSKFLILSTFARLPAILSSAMMGSTMRQGEWKVSLAVFLVTGILGLVGISYKDRILEFCHRFRK